MRPAHRNRCGRSARSTTEVRIVTGRMQDPVAPADFGERNVQFFPAALGDAGRTVQTAFLAAHSPVGECVDHNERSVIAVEGQQVECGIRIACVARDFDDVLEVVVGDPAGQAVGDVDFHPRLCEQNGWRTMGIEMSVETFISWT